MNTEFGLSPHIGFERKGCAGIVTLRRPDALNALTHAMILDLGRALAVWERDPEVAAVLVRSEGRAFSAGGDVAQVYRDLQAGRSPIAFFADEYRLNAYIRSYPKPYVALVDGIVMGGGAGISVHGSHRVFTEQARFAMPEVSIGFFPDVGGSYFLPRLEGRFGFLLGLTGRRIAWGDCLWSGIATHGVASQSLQDLTEEICATGDVQKALASRQVFPQPETNAADRTDINEVFAATALEEILARLSRRESAWAQQALSSMQRNSPAALHVTLRQLMAGETMSMEECMAMEFRIVTRMLSGHDFPEGIRAVLIDKDGSPNWRPATLAEVDKAVIDASFAPLPGGELQFGNFGDAP